jgi:hypothetical protein
MRRVAAVSAGPFLISSALSVWLVWSWRSSVSGYVAVYANLAAMLFAGMVGFAGLGLIVWERTRRLGVAVLVSAMWLYVSFVGVTNALYRLDLVPWKHERMVSILPGAGKGFYIYFKPGTSEAEIRKFSDQVIFDPPSSRGQDLKAGITSFVRVASSGNQETIAIGLRPDLTPMQRQEIRSRIEKESIVQQVTDARLNCR